MKSKEEPPLMTIQKLNMNRRPHIEISRNMFGAIQVEKKVNFYDIGKEKSSSIVDQNNTKILEDVDFNMCQNMVLA